MIYERHAINAYQSAVMTTPPLQAVVLLYDGVLVRLRNAEAAVARGDHGGAHGEASRAVLILRGLLAALDFERGGAVAQGLAETYRVNIQALMNSVGREDAQSRLARIAGGLRLLRNAWADIAGMSAQDPASGGSA